MIEQLYQMHHDPASLRIIKTQAAALLIKLNAGPGNPQNMAAAGVGVADDTQRGTSGRTASRPPQKVARPDKWAPSIQKTVPMSAAQGSGASTLLHRPSDGSI